MSNLVGNPNCWFSHAHAHMYEFPYRLEIEANPPRNVCGRVFFSFFLSFFLFFLFSFSFFFFVVVI